MERATKKYQDLWALILFDLHLIAFFAVAGTALLIVGYFINYFVKHVNDPKAPGNQLKGSTIYAENVETLYLRSLLICFGVGIASTTVYFSLLYKFAKEMITGTFIATIGIYFGIAAYMFVKGLFVPAFLFTLAGVFMLTS